MVAQCDASSQPKLDLLGKVVVSFTGETMV